MLYQMSTYKNIYIYIGVFVSAFIVFIDVSFTFMGNSNRVPSSSIHILHFSNHESSWSNHAKVMGMY